MRCNHPTCAVHGSLFIRTFMSKINHTSCGSECFCLLFHSICIFISKKKIDFVIKFNKLVKVFAYRYCRTAINVVRCFMLNRDDICTKVFVDFQF